MFELSFREVCVTTLRWWTYTIFKALIKTLVQNSRVLISDLEQAFIPLGLKHPRIISYFSPCRRYTNPVYGGDNESLNSRLVLRHSNIYLKSVIKLGKQFLKFV